MKPFALLRALEAGTTVCGRLTSERLRIIEEEKIYTHIFLPIRKKQLINR
ncbi:MAG: hypothetical protein JXA06_07980 [Bacteroidetes bacterium]|nr:hypothetical protein [Bacteroidota bacterium]